MLSWTPFQNIVLGLACWRGGQSGPEIFPVGFRSLLVASWLLRSIGGCIFYNSLFDSKPSLKFGTTKTICWNSLGLFRDYSLNYIFLRNKTFLFFKIESWNFQHLFEKKIVEPHNVQLIQTFFFSILSIHRNWVCFTYFFFQQMLKVSAFYLEKQRSFIPKRNMI